MVEACVSTRDLILEFNCLLSISLSSRYRNTVSRMSLFDSCFTSRKAYHLFVFMKIISPKRSTSDQEMDKVSEFCKIQEKATTNDMADWRNDIKPKSRITKCLDACVGEKLGMVRMKFSMLPSSRNKIS